MKLNTVILLTYSLAMIGCASSLKGKSMYPDSSITYRNGYILNKKGEIIGNYANGHIFDKGRNIKGFSLKSVLQEAISDYLDKNKAHYNRASCNCVRYVTSKRLSENSSI